MSKRILVFSTAYLPHIGGAEVAVNEIICRLGQKYKFDLITAKLSKSLPFREELGRVTVYRLGVGIPFIDKLILPFDGALFARHLQKKYKYELYWCIMASFASGAAYILNFFNKKKLPIVLNLQEGDSEKHLTSGRFGLIDFSWKLALKRTDYLCVLSEYLKKRALRLGYKGKISVIPNGVDIKKFDKDISTKERDFIREKEWGFSVDDVILITTSRLNIKNGIADVIGAMNYLPSNVKFVICGEGELMSELKDKVKKEGLDKRVIFMGSIKNDALLKYLKSADIFIRPSLSEGQGVSFIEAMTAKLPVIATRVGGITDFLIDGETGYFCLPENPESIAKTIDRLMADQNKGEIIKNAYNMVKDRYDWDKISPQIEKVFDSF